MNMYEPYVVEYCWTSLATYSHYPLFSTGLRMVQLVRMAAMIKLPAFFHLFDGISHHQPSSTIISHHEP